MSLLALMLPSAQESVSEEGLHIIIGMLITGLVFLAVILLGQLSRHYGHKRKARRAAQRRVY